MLACLAYREEPFVVTLRKWQQRKKPDQVFRQKTLNFLWVHFGSLSLSISLSISLSLCLLLSLTYSWLALSRTSIHAHTHTVSPGLLESSILYIYLPTSKASLFKRTRSLFFHVRYEAALFNIFCPSRRLRNLWMYSCRGGIGFFPEKSTSLCSLLVNFYHIVLVGDGIAQRWRLRLPTLSYWVRFLGQLVK